MCLGSRCSWCDTTLRKRGRGSPRAWGGQRAPCPSSTTGTLISLCHFLTAKKKKKTCNCLLSLVRRAVGVKIHQSIQPLPVGATWPPEDGTMSVGGSGGRAENVCASLPYEQKTFRGWAWRVCTELIKAVAELVRKFQLSLTSRKQKSEESTIFGGSVSVKRERQRQWSVLHC